MKTKNKALIMIIIFSIISCHSSDKKILVDENTQLELQAILDSKDISILLKNSDYIVDAKNSKLKTGVGKEYGSSVSALIIYKNIISKEVQLKTNTKINIHFDEGTIYSYDILELSNAFTMQDIISTLINDFKIKKFDPDYYACNTANDILSSLQIDWQKIEEINIGGFQSIRDTFCEQVKNVIVYRVFIIPEHKQLLFYFDSNDQKILDIKLKEGL